MAYQTPFQNSRFSWISSLAPARNQFVSFVQNIQPSANRPVTLHLFADTRFRLFVNEMFVAYGPARFVTQFADYDSYDLSPWLSSGENLVRVEVNYYGSSSFQSMPDGLPGFIAAGGSEDGTVDFTTPGNWKGIVHSAWDPQAPLFSFAQNPAEILNTHTLQQELASPDWKNVEALPESESPWTLLRPRSVPYPDYRKITPERLLFAAPAKEECDQIGIQFHDPDFYQRKGRPRKKTSQQLVGWIHSETNQTVKFETYWGEVEINGQACELDTGSLQGNHGFIKADLKAGWNFYSANVSNLTEHWSHLLGWPQDSGIRIHATPDQTDSDSWAFSPIMNEGSVFPAPASVDDFQVPEGWTRDSGNVFRTTPARLIAWTQPDETRAKRDVPWEEISAAGRIETSTAIWTLDFQDQYYGQPVIEVEAPAGSILDLAYDDWKREDGCVHLYNSNPFTDAADRFILQGGRQSIEVLNPRGGIFLQVVIHTPNGETAELTLHDLQIRSRQILKQDAPESSFSCGDPVMDWAWNTSINTIQASTDEAYADCPWRERGSYIGDSLVNLQLHRLVSAELSIARRTFLMMGEGQHLEGSRQGQLASVTPAWHRQGHDDFTLIWILCLRDYWNITGDDSLLKETWPMIRRIWDSPVWHQNENGLWDIREGMTPFYDWGIEKVDREGKSNLILNLFRLGALRATAEIEKALKQDFSNTECEIENLLTALQQTLWQEDKGRYTASENSDTRCLHGQVLALTFEAGDCERILQTIEPELLDNFRQGIEKGQNSGHLELYFHHYLLPALDRMGRNDLAEKFIHTHFEFLKGLGYPTLNECFCRAVRGVGSCCHSWSGAPAAYATKSILGLRQKQAGNPDAWIVDPHTETFTQARGVLPHAKGPIKVFWTRSEGTFDIKIEAPEGVEVTALYPSTARM